MATAIPGAITDRAEDCSHKTKLTRCRLNAAPTSRFAVHPSALASKGSYVLTTQDPRDSDLSPPGSATRGGIGEDLDRITRQLAGYPGVETVVLSVWEERDDWLIEVLSEAGLEPGSLVRSGAPGSDLVGWVSGAARADVRRLDPGRHEGLGAAASGAPLTHGVGVPMIVPGGLAGALCVGLSRAPDDEANTVWLVDSFARLAALCLFEDARAPDSQDPVQRHGLSMLLTRRALRDELAQAARLAERDGTPLSCCLVEVAELEPSERVQFRDDARHRLAGLAAAVAPACRAGDDIIVDGDRGLAVILAGADRAAAAVVADRIGAAIRMHEAALLQRPAGLSFGVVQRPPGASGAELLLMAEHALRRSSPSPDEDQTAVTCTPVRLVDFRGCADA